MGMNLLPLLGLTFAILTHPLLAQDTNPPAGRLPAAAPAAPAAPTNPPVVTSNEEIVINQGIKIWKKGTPTNGFTSIGYETLMRQRGFQNAANNIARGVLSRKGNAAIVSSIINSQRLNFDMNTQDDRLDGIDVRYQIIYIKP
jgi:hypothetical protein